MNAVVAMGVVAPAELRTSSKGTLWCATSLAWRCAGRLAVLPVKAFGRLAERLAEAGGRAAVVAGTLEEEVREGERRSSLSLGEVIPLAAPTFSAEGVLATDGWSQVNLSGMTALEPRAIPGGVVLRLAVRVYVGGGRFRETFTNVVVQDALVAEGLGALRRGQRVFASGSLLRRAKGGPSLLDVHAADVRVEAEGVGAQGEWAA